MDKKNGIDTSIDMRKIDKNIVLVFLTSSTDHMPDAFSVHAFGYLIKPLLPDKLYQVTWLRKHWPGMDRVVTKLEKRAESKSDTVERYGPWGLLLFVAIPAPGTGAWTGALIAALMNMRLKQAVPVILIGVCIAGLIVTGVTYGAIHVF